MTNEALLIRRAAQRARYDRETVEQIVDAALIAHVATIRDGKPVVIPMLAVRDGDWLLLHGAPASGTVRRGRGQPVCVEMTLLDGLVLARSAFHHSLNYRSVVIHGRAEAITDEAERSRALALFVERLVPGAAHSCVPPPRPRSGRRRYCACHWSKRRRRSAVGPRATMRTTTTSPSGPACCRSPPASASPSPIRASQPASIRHSTCATWPGRIADGWPLRLAAPGGDAGRAQRPSLKAWYSSGSAGPGVGVEVIRVHSMRARGDGGEISGRVAMNSRMTSACGLREPSGRSSPK